MSFDIPMDQVLQYAYNTFASASPMIYLYVGSAFGIFVIGALYRMVKGEK